MKIRAKKVASAILQRVNGFIPVYDYIKDKRVKKHEQILLDYLKSQENISVYNEPIIEVINLNANDVCNSRCVMCGIWKEEKTYEITPAELEEILKDPLYKHLKHIGVTGGEPTLREDLPQLFEAILKTVPTIRGVSLITNCIKEKTVIERVEQVIEMCKTYDKPFSMMVSLDGVGEVHEKVRCIKGNFQSAVNVLNHFKQKGISIATGTTISKINVWEVDDMLDYLKTNNIYGRFRVAEFIKRLHNEDETDVIRNFDEDETYHLILFFYKLILTFEFNEGYRRTYKSIINILAGGDRLIGCPYKRHGVVLNSRGEISYCAPKSKIIGTALEGSSALIYQENLDEKERILKQDCHQCIHDYHAPITYSEKLNEIERRKWEQILTIKGANKKHDFSKIQPIKKANLQAFITGWYGTETVGDKAILGQIILELRKEYGEDIFIMVSSLYPLITERTFRELDITNTCVIDAYSEDFVAAAKGADITIMGGGPLMDLEVLSLPLLAFKIAKENKKKTIVYGCGLGPLVYPQYIDAVKQILNLSDEIKLRDQKSVELAQTWLSKPKKIEKTGDPAKKYLLKYIYEQEENQEGKKRIIRCYLREWTYEYANGKYSKEEFIIQKELFEKGIAELIKRKVAELNADEVSFEHMHNFVVGKDDRDFSRYFINKYLSDVDFSVSYDKKLSTVDSIAHSMQDSILNICMRFHSVLFAHTLNTNFVAIDYTLGGKISNYLTDNNSIERMITKDQLTHKD